MLPSLPSLHLSWQSFLACVGFPGAQFSSGSSTPASVIAPLPSAPPAGAALRHWSLCQPLWVSRQQRRAADVAAMSGRCEDGVVLPSQPLVIFFCFFFAVELDLTQKGVFCPFPRLFKTAEPERPFCYFEVGTRLKSHSSSTALRLTGAGWIG